MSLAAFRRLGFAAWFVAIALIANLAAQNQLAVNVVEATAERAAETRQTVDPSADPHAHHKQMAGHEHHAPPAPVAAAAAHDHGASHHGPGGHTHKGHADCAVCGVVAVMAALTLPAAFIVHVPRDFVRPAHGLKADALHTAARYTPYASRAPPHFA